MLVYVPLQTTQFPLQMLVSSKILLMYKYVLTWTQIPIICYTTKKTQFLYLRLYFAVVSASAVKSTKPSSPSDFCFVRSLTWQIEKVPWGCPATGTLAFWSHQGLAGREGWVCWPDREEKRSVASPVPRTICHSFKSRYQNSWAELDALL